MNRADVGACVAAVALVLALSADTPSARAQRWQQLGLIAESGAWHLWRLGVLAHDRHSTIMMDIAQRGTTQ